MLIHLVKIKNGVLYGDLPSPSLPHKTSPVPSGSVQMKESACPKGILNISSDVPERGAVIECYSDTDLSFDIWDNSDHCPHCGSDDVEIDIEEGYAVCLDCDRHSACVLTDDLELETYLMNNLDRFDYLGIFESDHVGQ